jgi:glyoxylate/hydroxypyruvate reductase
MASAIMVAVTGWDPGPWFERFRSFAPDRDIRLWPDQMGDAADIAYACVWKPPSELLQELPNLKAIFSLGAGVDHFIGDATLPDVPIVRIVDPDLTMRMTEYVVLQVLMIHRRQRMYDAQQAERRWQDHDQWPASAVAVGIMGLGVLGRDAAQVLRRIGFKVAGWSRTPKHVPGIETFHGPDGLDVFLRRSEILVCLLPHTSATEGILNLNLFRALKRDGALGGAYLINAGRGKLQIDTDIVEALDEGALAGATLDVFPVEPLPPGSPLWSHPKIAITPHNAAASDAHALAANVLNQIARFERGEPFEHVVDRRVGY